MRKFLCKVFRFLLDLVSQVVDLVAKTLIMVGTAAVEVLSQVAGAARNALLKNPLVLGVLGVIAFMYLSGDDEKSDELPVRST